MKNLMIACLFICMTMGSALPAKTAERSPFEEPQTPETLYNYRAASLTIHILGLIITDTDAKVILRTATEERSSVHSSGDQIHVRRNGVDHDFLIRKIKARGLLLKAANGERFEVEVK